MSPQYAIVDTYPCVDSRGGEGWEGCRFYEFIETTQAILVSLILTDGSAQAVSYTVDALKVIVRNLK